MNLGPCRLWFQRFGHAGSRSAETCPVRVRRRKRWARPRPLRRRTVWGKGRSLPEGGARMLLVTGGAGFIGSNVVASLNEAGRADIAVNDILGTDDKWRNLGKRQLADVIPPGALFDWLGNRKLDAVIHLGAISDT